MAFQPTENVSFSLHSRGMTDSDVARNTVSEQYLSTSATSSSYFGD